MIDADYIKSELIGKTFIDKVYYFHEIESTNTFAKLLDEDNVLVLTDYQTHGKGRMDRTWESEKGSNLMFTIKKKLDIDLKEIQSVNFFISYFLHEAIRSFIEKMADKKLNPELEIKWPNDLLLGSKKVCGILIENSLNRKDFVIGIGINVNQQSFNHEFSGGAESLKNYLEETIDLSELLLYIIRKFDDNLGLIINKQYDKLYTQWKNATKIIGKEVKYIDPENHFLNGKIIDLQRDGGIKIKSDEGIKTFYSSDIKIHSF